MAGNPDFSSKVKKRRYMRKPYDRTTDHASTSGSYVWSNRNETHSWEDNPSDKSLLQQVTSSVSGLFSKSWKISEWFRSKKEDKEQRKDSISDDDDIISETEGKSTSFKQIYPEGGASDDVIITTTSDTKILDKGKVRREEGEPSNINSTENQSLNSMRAMHHLISSTPAPSTSREHERNKVTIEDDDDIESLPELEDVSVIAHPGNDTTYRDRLNIEENSMTFPSSIMRARPPLADRKRHRESFEGLGGTPTEDDGDSPEVSDYKNLPQTGLLAKKRPRFSLSGYPSPLVNSSSLDTSRSLFYPGKTMYGGAGNFRRSRRTPVSKPVLQAQVKIVQNGSNDPTEDGGLSLAAKRILDCLNNMSTPLSDAKRMPLPQIRQKMDLFDSSPYVAHFHRHRPTLKTDRTPASTPPTKKLLVPGKANVKDNLSFLIKSCSSAKSPIVSSPSTVMENVPSLLPTENRSYAKISPEKSITTQESSSCGSSFFTNTITFSRGGSTQSTLKSSYSLANVTMSASEEGKRTWGRDKFKITHHDKESPTKYYKDLEAELNLPKATLPVSSMPKIDFSGIKQLTPTFTSAPLASSSTTSISKSTGNFKFSAPAILASPSTNIQMNIRVPSTFVFRQPVSENVISKQSESKEFLVDKDFGYESQVSDKALETNPSLLSSKESSTFLKSVSSATASPSWGDKFKPAKDSWTCDTCLITNKSVDALCVACQTPQPSKSVNTASSNPTSKLENAPLPSSGFGNMFKKPTNEWTCDVCMINNKNDVSKCVACETSKPGAPVSSNVPVQYSGFGNMFKKPTNEWTCDVCLVNNKNDANKCVACETPKPGASVSSNTDFGSRFKISTDEWECGTCLVRNKNSTKNCVSCETPRNQQMDNIVSKALTGNFKFGTSNNNNTFKFGIGKNENGKTQETPAVNLNFGAPKAEVSASTTSSFKFGVSTMKDSSSTTTSFKFGTPATEVGTLTPTPSFKFGTPSTDVGSTTTPNLKLNVSSSMSIKPAASDSVSKVDTSAVPSTSASFKFGLSTTSSSANFNFGSSSASSNKDDVGSSIVKEDASKLSFNFKKNDNTKVSSNINFGFSTQTVSKPDSNTKMFSFSGSVDGKNASTKSTSEIEKTATPPFVGNKDTKDVLEHPSTTSALNTLSTTTYSISSSLPGSVKSSDSFFSFKSSVNSPVVTSSEQSSISTTPKSSFLCVYPTTNINASTNTVNTVTSIPSTMFSFGGPATSGTFSFGSKSTSSIGSAFDASASKAVSSASAPSFSKGSTASTFSFTSNATTNSFSTMPNVSKTSTADTTGLFSFGSTSNPPSFSFGNSQKLPSGSGFSEPNKGSSNVFLPSFTSPNPPLSTALSSTAPSFVFGQSQEKKSSTTFNFGQAASTAPNPSSFTFGSTPAAPTAAMFQFQQSTSFVPRSASSSTGESAFGKKTTNTLNTIPTENAFSVLSNPTAAPQKRVIKRAIRRNK